MSSNMYSSDVRRSLPFFFYIFFESPSFALGPTNSFEERLSVLSVTRFRPPNLFTLECCVLSW